MSSIFNHYSIQVFLEFAFLNVFVIWKINSMKLAAKVTAKKNNLSWKENMVKLDVEFVFATRFLRKKTQIGKNAHKRKKSAEFFFQ